MLLPENLQTLLPASADCTAIQFVDAKPDTQPFATLPTVLNKHALAVSDSTADVILLTLPNSSRDDEELLTATKAWIDNGKPIEESPCLLLTLQGVQLLWSPQRVALFADEGRTKSLQTVVLQVTYYLLELNRIEAELGTYWSQLESDTPLAFDFKQADIHKREQLLKRFQEIVQLRSCLARLTPFLLCPHVYPPTLASQLGERLRERTRVEEREEFVSDQLEVFEEVYEMCGQRASEFVLARSSNTLEWVIIILLVVQIIFSAFDYLIYAGAANAVSVG